jgi:uncharacterized iron-regulated membrane protein
MRFAFVRIHRYAGLLIAAFLFVSGVTGAVISWDHELDDLLNPHLMEARATGAPLQPLQLAKEIEARDPQVRVTYVPLAAEPGGSYVFGLEPRVNPANGELYEPGYNEVFIDPASGAELGRREWGGVWPITRENLVSFLYVLHYSLHMPEMWGIDLWGLWLLGGIAIIWTLDCFVGFYLTLPARRAARAEEAATADPAPNGRSWWQRWTPAWKVRWAGGSTKLNFDLHRAFSLWTWALLFIVAFTGFSLNLYSEIFYPIMSKVSQVTPSAFDSREPRDHHNPIEPRIGFAEVIERARAETQRRGWPEPVGSVYYSSEYGIYSASLYKPGDDHGAAGVGPPELYFDSGDGAVLGDRQPWQGTAADIFVQAQFPLHSGRILGLPGRILISAMGVVVAMLSVTGVIIWLRKRRSSQKKSLRSTQGIEKGASPGRTAPAYSRRK